MLRLMHCSYDECYVPLVLVLHMKTKNADPMSKATLGTMTPNMTASISISDSTRQDVDGKSFEDI